MPQLSSPVAAEPSGPGGWSDEAVDRLKALWSQEALSAAAIARQLGVSRNAVLGKVHRLGLSNRRAKSGPRPAACPPRKPKRPRPVPRRCRVVQTTPQVSVTAADGPGLVRRLERLAPQACHWPIGDPRDEGFAFCGRPAGARIYCPAHWALGHRPRTRR